MNDIIAISHLNKSFGEVKAVQDLSFKVKQGELFAFLGVNGAGKSTTISIMCGQLSKDSGQVTICGQKVEAGAMDFKQQLGVVYQSSALDGPLTVKENLLSRAALYGMTRKQAKKRIEELSDLLDFRSFLNRPVGKLSGGQRRRADIARALLHHPKILILDEPTTGLDPQTRQLLWQVIARLQKEEGMTVFLTTHYMEEAADADYVIILNQGKIAAEGTPLDLKNTYTGDFISLYGVGEEQVKQLGQDYTAIVGGYRIFVKNTTVATQLIRQFPDIFIDYEITKGKMDDVFLAVTGLALTGGDAQ
jgi:multidrug/hemolysin transport system ATP-binding protein